MDTTNEEPRKLDVAESATIDILSLNNKVVLMRPQVRKAKYQTVQKIIRAIQVLKNKKGSEEQLEKNKRKVDRLLEDIQAIKTLRPSKVSKFALANTLTLDEICRKPDTGAETRALARLAEHQVMKTVVARFREQHSDWKALADFLLGHISRRFFSNKFKTEKFKMVSNRKAGNQLMKSYLENKIVKDKEIDKTDNIDADNEDEKKLTVKKKKKTEELIEIKVKAGVLPKTKHTHNVDIFSKHSDDVDDSDLDKNDKDFHCESQKSSENFDSDDKEENVDSDSKKEGSENLDSEDEMEGSENSESKDNKEGSENLDSEDEMKGSENSESKDKKEGSENLHSEDEIEGSENSDSEAEKQNVESYSDSEDEKQNVEINSENSDSEVEKESSESYSDSNEQEESKNNSNTKMSGEMVVKKFNVDDLLNNKDVEVPSFLINQSCEENVTKVKKSKDSFFMFGDGDGEEKDDIDNHSENDSDTDESVDEKINTNRNINQSSFIGALNEAKPSRRDFDNSGGMGWGRGQMDKFGQNRRGFQNFERRGRGFQNFERRGRGFQNFERRGRGFQNFERGGRGNFQSRFRNVPQNAPQDFQRSGGRGRGSRGSFDSRQQQPGLSKQIKDHGNSSTGSKDSGKTSEKIHPSWEASKKRKEHLSIQAFQGKKIKFDED